MSACFAAFAKWRTEGQRRRNARRCSRNLTPIGSASTLVAVAIMRKNGLAMSLGRFVKLAIPFAALRVADRLGYGVRPAGSAVS